MILANGGNRLPVKGSFAGEHKAASMRPSHITCTVGFAKVRWPLAACWGTDRFVAASTFEVSEDLSLVIVVASPVSVVAVTYGSTFILSWKVPSTAD